jgi:hypothetical protein
VRFSALRYIGFYRMPRPMTPLSQAVAAALLLSAPSALLAQWPSYTAAGVPRTAEGKPDLTAAAPRTADGKPDLSGVWQHTEPAGTPARAPGPRDNVVSSCDSARDQFCNIAAGHKDGLPFQPWAAELRRQRVVENSKDNPDSHCLPLGVMQFHTHPYPRKMIQTPGVIVILNEANGGVRQIFTDGRPSPKDPQPWWYGYSVGRWEGDTLVVESAGFRDLGWLDFQGSPLTESGKLTERFRRLDYGHLEIEVTVDDPKAYTKPWTIKLNQHIVLDTDLLEYVCLEGERDVTHMVGK